MSRILFFVFLAFLFWLVIRLLAAHRKRRDDSADAAERAAKTAPRAVETMNQCAWCGAHVPAPEALAIADGRIYCSSAHRDAALGSTTGPRNGDA